MLFRFAAKTLGRLWRDVSFTAGFPREVVKAFRKRVQFIRGAADERDFYAMKSLHFERLKGKRKHQRSMRLNDQFRLILTIERDERGATVVLIDIEDYH